ncbi:MAG: SDR family NAD(P)-dependent oxidoreductase [Prevotella sp.]|nr:SDR family NAD(P)-dependent oxidoreductase [Prevotella sp.]MBO5641704.1 SDR family NAD(P)-dependent oxidoreductase [Prevotella sp.]
MNIVIIGATSGIGKALFEKYANENNRIGIIGRRAHLVDELYQKYPSKAIPAKADITNLEEIGQAICSLHETLGHIDLAIVCAGTGDINATLDYSIERPAIDTNIVGWTFVIDMLYHILEQQGHGHLVAITSAGGLRGESMAPAYSATKAYQINYMEALRKKAFKNGGHIIVTDIRPGLVDTAMAKGEGLFWVMPVEKVANQIITAIRKKKSKAYVTKRWHILAIINIILPYCLYKRM